MFLPLRKFVNSLRALRWMETPLKSRGHGLAGAHRRQLITRSYA